MKKSNNKIALFYIKFNGRIVAIGCSNVSGEFEVYTCDNNGNSRLCT